MDLLVVQRGRIIGFLWYHIGVANLGATEKLSRFGDLEPREIPDREADKMKVNSNR